MTRRSILQWALAAGISALRPVYGQLGSPVQRAAVLGSNFSPLQLPGLILWGDATDATTLYQDSALTTAATADADPVGGWKDKSGQANHVLQATAGKRPTLKLGIQNGRNTLLFDGVDDFLDNAAPTVGTVSGFSIFLVTSIVTSTSFGMHFIPLQGIYEMRQLGADAKPNFDLNGLDVESATGGVGTWNIWEGVVDKTATTYEFVVDGALQGSGTRAYGGDTNVLRFGARSASNAANCRIGEVIVCNQPLTITDRIRARRYLKAKWGTP